MEAGFFYDALLTRFNPFSNSGTKVSFHLNFTKTFSSGYRLFTFNGTVYYNTGACEHVHVDACNKTAGIFWQGHWRYTVFECDMPLVASLHINYKEICAVVKAVDYWAPFWQGKTVIIHTDSVVTKAAINKGWSKNSYVNCLLRKMAWTCKVNCKLKAVHVPGSLNALADTISRLHEKGKVQLLVQLLSRWHHGPIPASRLLDHMSTGAFVFLFDRCQRAG